MAASGRTQGLPAALWPESLASAWRPDVLGSTASVYKSCGSTLTSSIPCQSRWGLNVVIIKSRHR